MYTTVPWIFHGTFSTINKIVALIHAILMQQILGLVVEMLFESPLFIHFKIFEANHFKMLVFRIENLHFFCEWYRCYDECAVIL